MTAVSWWRTGLGVAEVAGLTAAVAEGCLGDGPVTAAFETAAAAMLGVPHAIAVPSGSAALLMAMIALEIGPGDEVIVPDATWIATAHAASLLGARVVPVDTRPDRPVLDAAAVARAVTPRTRAILPVHLGGRAVELDPLLDLAARHGLRVVEDACQALLSRDARACLGTRGDIGCYSLGVAKLLTTGQGGLAVTRDPALYERMRRVKLHGVAQAGGWEVYERPGWNFKFTDMMAAVGLAQLKGAAGRVAHVGAIHRRYCEGLANLPRLRVSALDLEAGEVPLWTEIEIADGRLPALVGYLNEREIQTRRVHPPLHRAPHLAAMTRDERRDFPNATRQCETLLVLPSGPTQPLDNIDRTIEAVRRWSLENG